MRSVFGLYTSSYRVFTINWLKEHLSPRFYYGPLVCAWQRATRGFADADLWDFDSYITDIVIGAVPKLMKQGFPVNVASPEEWDHIANTIVEGFQAYRRLSENKWPEDFFTELETSTGLAADLGIQDRVYDWKKIKAWERHETALFNKGFKLFHKHFRSLWD